MGPWCKCQEMVPMDYMGDWFLVFWEVFFFSKRMDQLTFSPAVNKGFFFPSHPCQLCFKQHYCFWPLCCMLISLVWHDISLFYLYFSDDISCTIFSIYYLSVKRLTSKIELYKKNSNYNINNKNGTEPNFLHKEIQMVKLSSYILYTSG